VTHQHLYDVFLSHQSGDKPQIEALAARLEDEAGLKPFLDKWHLIPGEPWQEALEEALNQSKTCAVFLGPGGLGPWENEEMRVALDERVSNKTFRVIPVLLPGAEPKDKKTLPRFLSRLTWVDFRGGLDDPETFRRLVAGIRGLAPGRQPAFTRQEDLRIFSLPFPRNKFFIGRDDILKDIHKNFNAGERAQALSGMPGVGKTQTALQYAYQYQRDYRIVLWGNAASRETLVTDFVAMAGLLNLPEKNAQDQSEAVNAVKRWLGNNDGWLLVLDNADELALAREFIPSRESGRVLLTTRAQNTKPIAARQAVEKMQPQEGALFLLRRLEEIKKEEQLESAPEEMRIQAEALSKAVDGLPLALDQAAAFIEETPSTLEEYQTLYQSKRKELLKLRGTLAEDHPSVTVTFLLAFKKVTDTSPAAADVLRVCAFLEADSIPEEIFSGGARELGEALSSTAESSLDLIKAIGESARFSLLRRHPEPRTLSLHRLVQAVLRDEMDGDTRRMWAERAVRALNVVFPGVEYSAWPLCDRLISHAQSLASLIDEHGFDFPEAARLLNQAGDYLNERAQYAEAEPLLQSTLDIREKALGPEHQFTANSLNSLALLYKSQGRFAEAEPLLQRALDIREKALDPEHPDTAQSLNNLAILYNAQLRYAEAESLLQRALDIREIALGPEHPDTAQSLNNLATLYYSQGRYRYAEAEPLFKRALAIYEKTLGPEHPSTAMFLNNLAALYYSQGRYRYAEAEPLLQRALDIYEKAFGPEHPDTALSLSNLAALYDSQGRYAEAEPLYKRTLDIREKMYGPEHPYTVTMLRNYAAMLREMGRDNEADELEARGGG
jgi:tetratricopeptide (TPR) repeat protein